tara:strand:+ start:440 stop:694 length:255 start_codon:yes stop_codon:yes gene_type:complete
MLNELNKKLMEHLDKMQQCKDRILDINNLIKENGYKKEYVDLLVDFNVIKTKIEFQIEDTQEGIEIMHRSIAYQKNKTNKNLNK